MIIVADDLVRHWSADESRAQLEKLKDAGTIDFVWHLGDIGYIDDELAHNPTGVCTGSGWFSTMNCYEKTYNGYMNWIQNVTAQVPYMVTVGNHESECHDAACVMDTSFGEPLRNFSAYNHRWRMPSSSSGGVLSMWYSFNYGPAHFVSINTETDFKGAAEEDIGDSGLKKLPAGHFAPKGAYIQWLEQDLQRASQERHLRPWIIVGGHRPLDDITDSPGGQEISALLQKYGVSMYLAGHLHSYARLPSMCGVIASDGESDQRCIQEIVVGGAGCDEMADTASPETPLRGWREAPVFTTKRTSTGVLNISPSALHFRLLDSADGSLLDEVYVKKSAAGGSQPTTALLV